MKKIKYFVLLSLCLCVVGLNTAKAQQINPKIQEVYGSKTQDFIYKMPDKIKFLTDILDNRFNIIESPIHEKENYLKLSEVDLLNKYNPNLTRDVVFDAKSFNPLKYNFNFYSKNVQAYRVDGTDFLIVIKPQSF